jgi:hypothetical protein
LILAFFELAETFLAGLCETEGLAILPELSAGGQYTREVD